MDMSVTVVSGMGVVRRSVSTRFSDECSSARTGRRRPRPCGCTCGAGVYDGVRTPMLDELSAETAASLASHHPDYARLAGNIAVFQSAQDDRLLRSHPSSATRTGCEGLEENVLEIDSRFQWERDYTYDYFGFKTLEKSYLLRDDKGIVERPQVMLMRVALGIHCGNLPDVFETLRVHVPKGLHSRDSHHVQRRHGIPTPCLLFPAACDGRFD